MFSISTRRRTRARARGPLRGPASATGPEPTVLVSVGGTAVGAELVTRCLAAFSAAQKAVPGLRMRVVCGPRLHSPEASVPEGVEVAGYVSRLYEHFAATDLSIVQAGGATTLELTVLKRPFLYFPLENHCEQLMHVAPRQRRLGAGVELRLATTSQRSWPATLWSTSAERSATRTCRWTGRGNWPGTCSPPLRAAKAHWPARESLLGRARSAATNAPCVLLSHVAIAPWPRGVIRWWPRWATDERNPGLQNALAGTIVRPRSRP